MITVNITVGGLCMFVQQPKDPKGLWVLMPSMADDPMMRHCAMLIVDIDPEHGNKRMLYSLANKDIDLTTAGSVECPPVRPPVPTFMFEASKYAGNVGVAARYFGATMEPDLIARVRMPLGTTFRPIVNSPTDLGDILVDNIGPVKTTGMVEATFSIDGTKPLSIPVAGTSSGVVNLTAPSGGRIHVTIANAPRSHIDLEKRIKHAAGELITHPRMFYTLLDGQCGNGKACPEVRSIYNVGEIPDPGYPACPTSPEPLPPITARFIEPINCSVGYGCGSADPC